MSDKIGYPEITRMLLGAVEQIRQNHQRLSELDNAVGDGDHGTTILRCMETLAETIAQDSSRDPATLFSNIAWAVMSCDGGSTGPLLGSFFMGLSKAAENRTEFDQIGFTGLLEAGITHLQKQSKAQVGDKTMMDAFLPALAALKEASPSDGIKSALQKAAEAAAQGAEATRKMRAKFGRARNLGDRVIGHLDPGAVSVSLIFKGFAEARIIQH
jgi:dihydroxyacetone kinase-like protein